MEDSEKRRERLKAMRTVAAQAEASHEIEASAVPSSLANPLLEPPPNLSSRYDAGATPRFDFYTDPMAAFSANKKRSIAGDHVTQGYYTPPSTTGSPVARFSFPRPREMSPVMTPFPAPQMQSTYLPNQRINQAVGPFDSAAPYRTPRSMASPFPQHQRAPEGWGSSGEMSSYGVSIPHGGTHSPFPVHQGIPGFGPVRSPTFRAGGARTRWLDNSPYPGSGYESSHAPNQGRGCGRWHVGSMAPGSRWSSGRGRGYRSPVSAADETLGPECFYDQSMVGDPWQNLEPVLWRGLDIMENKLNTLGSSNSWLPKSIIMKKTRVSESFGGSSSKQSLAEYLAASFDEAVNDESSEDVSNVSGA